MGKTHRLRNISEFERKQWLNENMAWKEGEISWYRDPKGKLSVGHAHWNDSHMSNSNGYHYNLKLRKGETEETCQRQARKVRNKPCSACFRGSEGRMWMLRVVVQKLSIKQKVNVANKQD